MTVTSTRPASRTRPRVGALRESFLLRWVVAIILAVTVALAVETVVADRQLRAALLEQYAREHVQQAAELQHVLEEPAWRSGLAHELEAWSHRPGIIRLTVVDATGDVVAAAGETDDDDIYDAAQMARVFRTGEPWHGPEPTEPSGEVEEETAYEFLVPIVTGEDGLVLQIDQHETLLDTVVRSVRKQNLWTAGLILALVLPLSYAFGGRALGRALHARTKEAGTDPLTGLSSRRTFDAALDRRLAGAEATTSLALVDLDEFKGINDRLGHSYGDRVLVALADACRAVLGAAGADARGPGHQAYRLGGDEFALVLPTDCATAVRLVEEVRAAFTRLSPGATMSVGVASSGSRHDGGALSRSELLERADAALYEAKRRGRRQTVTFETLSASVSVSADKIQAVLGAVGSPGGLTAAFQPIWDLRDRTLIGYEALCRLPEGSPLAGPADAFEIAVGLGVVAELDARARETALAAVTTFDPDHSLFLNVHPTVVPLLDVDDLAASVVRAGLETSQVVLEVTEQLPWASVSAVERLRAAQDRGFRLALDDLGAGNNGLQALSALSFDILKLDRAVVEGLPTDPGAKSVMAAALTYASHTGALVIAEGIETLSQLHAVEEPDSDWLTVVRGGQGYLLGRPAAGPLAEPVYPHAVVVDAVAGVPAHP